MNEIIEAIHERLKPSGWFDELRLFLVSAEFTDIITKLKKGVDEDKKRFTPPLKIAFRFLEECPVDKVKVLILGETLYTQLGQSDGIPFSCNSLSKPDSVLTPILESVGYTPETMKSATDLKKWAKQGVLMIPIPITSIVDGNPQYKLWAAFISYLLDKVNRKHPNIPCILMGPKTHGYEEILDTPHVKKLFIRPLRDHHNCWEYTNEILKKQRNGKINW